MIGNLKSKFISFYYKNKAKKILKSYKEPLKIGGRVSFNADTYLGKNCNFNGFRVDGTGKIIIGNNFHSGTDIIAITSNHNYEGECLPYDDIDIKKTIIIEDNVWIGSKVTILGGVTIGEGSIIQAGSVVSKSIPKYAIAGGNPAKPFKYRDIEHYEKLKKEGKFC